MVINRKRNTRIPIQRISTQEESSQPDDIDNMHDEIKGENINADPSGDLATWRDAALRLKAEMHNYHKRQQQWAHDEVRREKEKLLLAFTDILEHLEQSVLHLDTSESVYRGVKIAYDDMRKLLKHEGVERIHALNATFDPAFHEAVAVVPALDSQSEELKVVEVASSGYTINSRVLKPAKVIVAKKE